MQQTPTWRRGTRGPSIQRNLQIYTQVKLRNMVCKACDIEEKDNGLGCMSGADWLVSIISLRVFAHSVPAH